MDKHMNHSWEPKLTSYPLLILDDHATEWAERIADRDHADVRVDGENEELAHFHGEDFSEQSHRAADTRAADDCVADRVRWNDVSSALCS